MDDKSFWDEMVDGRDYLISLGLPADRAIRAMEKASPDAQRALASQRGPEALDREFLSWFVERYGSGRSLAAYLQSYTPEYANRPGELMEMAFKELTKESPKINFANMIIDEAA